MSTPLERPADWLTVREALDRILGALQPLPVEQVALPEALGRVLAEPVVSPIDQPPWTNSGMDGFACRAEDVRGATRERPRELRIIEEVPAGAFPSRRVGPGVGVRLMTGAPVPDGADTVVRLEHTRPVSAEVVAVERDEDAGRNLRQRGEDLRAGSVVLEAGTLIRPGEIGVLATVGRGEVPVHRRARVAILSNGDELVDLDGFDQVLAGRRIVNSNAYGLAAAVATAGGDPLPLGIAGDTRESLRQHIGRAAGVDALITTAGASVGDFDLVKDVLEELGYRLDFWRVQVQPGSPLSFGFLGEMPVFGLAGNPVSALVTFEVFVRPALRKLHGRTAVYPRLVRVRAAERIRSRAGRMRFLRATLEPAVTGEVLARITGPQGSGILSSMARADALVLVPVDVDAVEAGTALWALPLRGDESTATNPF